MCNNKSERHGHHGHAGKNPDSLYGMMRRCGHILHHDNPDPKTVFDGLTQEEQAQLKELMSKLLASLKLEKEADKNDTDTAE